MDPLGLETQLQHEGRSGGCCEQQKEDMDSWRPRCAEAVTKAARHCYLATQFTPPIATEECANAYAAAFRVCDTAEHQLEVFARLYLACVEENNCEPPTSCSQPDPDSPNDELLKRQLELARRRDELMSERKHLDTN
jgi:hypothetical protein